MDFSTNLTTNIISFISLTVSVTVFYFYFKDRKREKFLLTAEYRKQLLDWHGETVELLIFLRMAIERNSKEKYSDALSRLSAQIEKGRFFFPNIDKGDDFGKDKPDAYRGYRNLTLDFLVYSFNIFAKEDAEKYIGHLYTLQREFTSIVFQIVRPNTHLLTIKKLTDIYWSRDEIFEDFLKRDPNSIHYISKSITP